MRRFELTPEQEELQRAARTFVEKRLPTSHLRALRDAKDPTHVSRAVWREMAALGWAGIAVDEAHGGAGLGLVELGLVMEELGRTLAPTPLLATSVIGAAALAAWRTLRPALLLTDLHMPGMDGYALAAALRAAEAAEGRGRLPIVALTAQALHGEAERCRAAGMDDYLSKPVDREDLAATLARWLPVAAGEPAAGLECDEVGS